MTTALLVIDLQNALIAEGHRTDAVLAVARDLIERARRTDTPVIYLRHEHTGGGPLVRGASTWEIHEQIAPRAGDVTLDKRANDGFYRTSLDDELRARGVTRVVITGMATEQCVETTARSALSHDYDVTVVADGHTSVEYPGVLSVADRIAYHNLLLSHMATPDHAITVAPGADVRFTNE